MPMGQLPWASTLGDNLAFASLALAASGRLASSPLSAAEASGNTGVTHDARKRKRSQTPPETRRNQQGRKHGELTNKKMSLLSLRGAVDDKRATRPSKKAYRTQSSLRVIVPTAAAENERPRLRGASQEARIESGGDVTSRAIRTEYVGGAPRATAESNVQSP